MDSRTGEFITAHQAENGVYIWEITNPLYFKTYQGSGLAVHKDTSVPHPNTVQPQPQESIGSPPRLTSPSKSGRLLSQLLKRPYLTRFWRLVMMFLDQLGVITLYYVIRAVRFATHKAYVNYVLENHDIKFKFYLLVIES
ncbi:replication enhancer protein [Sida micrantha mosaic virus-[snap bean:Brazil:2003]]|nr:replication enhancer protein [Sida micrantha mosaic virus-[snap bean:Brazil:2003]]